MEFRVGIYLPDGEKVEEYKIEHEKLETDLDESIIKNKAKSKFMKENDPTGELGGTIGFDFRIENEEVEDW